MYNPALRLRELQAKTDRTDEETREMRFILKDKEERDEHDRQFQKRWESQGGMSSRYKPKFYDQDGTPITMWEWGYLHEDFDYKSLMRTDVDGYLVSTVWLGSNHAGWGEKRILIFETMVFDDRGKDPDINGDDLYMRRYETKSQALAGHEETVQFVKDVIAGRCSFDGEPMGEILTEDMLNEIIRP